MSQLGKGYNGMPVFFHMNCILYHIIDFGYFGMKGRLGINLIIFSGASLDVRPIPSPSKTRGEKWKLNSQQLLFI